MRKTLKLVALFGCACAAVSCATTSRAPLYYWGGRLEHCSVYEEYAYKSYKRQTPQATCNMLCALEDMTAHPGGTRGVPPPGICAEYAYMLLTPGMAALFTENATQAQKMLMGTDRDYNILFRQKGEQMFLKEIENYPESEKFIKPIIKKLAGK